MYGLVGGFLILGWMLGKLDHAAAVAEQLGDYPALFKYFLPAVALIQPNGSIIELTSGAAAAWVGAYAWGWVWTHWKARR